MNIRNNKRGQAVRGSQVLLECSVGAARPAANVTWYNGTTPVRNDSKRLDMLETKIIESVSKLYTSPHHNIIFTGFHPFNII